MASDEALLLIFGTGGAHFTVSSLWGEFYLMQSYKWISYSVKHFCILLILNNFIVPKPKSLNIIACTLNCIFRECSYYFRVEFLYLHFTIKTH